MPNFLSASFFSKGKLYSASLSDKGTIVSAGGEGFTSPRSWLKAILGSRRKVKNELAWKMVMHLTPLLTLTLQYHIFSYMAWCKAEMYERVSLKVKELKGTFVSGQNMVSMRVLSQFRQNSRKPSWVKGFPSISK